MPTCTALIVAAGRGLRFGGDLPKQYLALVGQPILRRTVEAFLRHPQVNAVRVVIDPAFRDLYDKAVDGLDLPPPITGGPTRQDSVLNGLEAMAGHPTDLVLIHDAARPLIDAQAISDVIAALESDPAAIAATPLADTLKRGTVAGAGIVSGGTVDRTALWRALTPQGFRFADILPAHRRAAGLNLTDDAAVAEEAGLPVTLVPCDPDNLKVTNQDDLARAEKLFLARLGDVRTGTGFDVHKFAPGDQVWLCGVSVPHDATLDGHSDADVALHALTDAILGAISAGDIGLHFPPSDPKWKGADSARFLRHAADLVAEKGVVIAHVDITIIC